MVNSRRCHPLKWTWGLMGLRTQRSLMSVYESHGASSKSLRIDFEGAGEMVPDAEELVLNLIA